MRRAEGKRSQILINSLIMVCHNTEEYVKQRHGAAASFARYKRYQVGLGVAGGWVGGGVSYVTFMNYELNNTYEAHNVGL